jgi:hypothetical protein
MSSSPCLDEHANVEEAVNVIRGRPLLRRIASEAAALAHEAAAVARIFRARMLGGDRAWLPHGAALPAGTRGHGLVLLLHGLNGHPAQFHALLARVRSCLPRLDCVAPLVLHRGHGGCGELLAHPLGLVDAYVARHGGSVPVAVVGVSNGGRLACWAEIQLRTRYPSMPVLVSSVAGVLGGTAMMRIVRPLRWINGYHPAILEDFCVGSVSSQSLKESITGVASYSEGGGMRRITMYAATQDSRVVPWRHSLLDVARNARIVTVRDHEHSSILFAVVEDQTEQLAQFFDLHSSLSSAPWLS